MELKAALTACLLRTVSPLRYVHFFFPDSGQYFFSSGKTYLKTDGLPRILEDLSRNYFGRDVGRTACLRTKIPRSQASWVECLRGFCLSGANPPIEIRTRLSQGQQQIPGSQTSRTLAGQPAGQPATMPSASRTAGSLSRSSGRLITNCGLKQRFRTNRSAHIPACPAGTAYSSPPRQSSTASALGGVLPAPLLPTRPPPPQQHSKGGSIPCP